MFRRRRRIVPMGQSAASLRSWIRRSSARKSKHNPWRLKEKNKGIDLSGASATASDWDLLELECEEKVVASVSPKKNLGALALLDSWLAVPEVPENENAEAMRRRIDKYRLSDRKFFTS
jgi:hypothetical protein